MVLSSDTGALTKETKEEADRQILKATEKEERHLNRPNANPSGKEEVAIEQEHPELKKISVSIPYVFQNPLNHRIIKVLEETSNEGSSYSGVKVSREEFENFVKFLKNAECEERIKATGETMNREELRHYYYAPDKGKGSHIKVKLGRGTKPVILSQQGQYLTTGQLEDLKAVIRQKGLL